MNRKKSVAVSCQSSGTEETLYTCPDNCQAEVVFLYAVNAGAHNADTSISWKDSDDSELAHIMGEKNLSAEGSENILNLSLILTPSQYITVTATGTSPHVDAICTVYETFKLPR